MSGYSNVMMDFTTPQQGSFTALASNPPEEWWGLIPSQGFDLVFVTEDEDENIVPVRPV